MPLAQQLTDPVAYHGEGAVWFAGWGGLKWVDMLAGDILSLDAGSGAVTRLHVGSPVAAMVRPRVGAGFVVATERGFSVWGLEGPEWSTPDLWESAERRRFNEGGCDPSGALLCGSLSYDRVEGAGEVWRLGLDGSTERLFGGVTISNGLGFTADGSRMFYVDSRTRRVDVFDVDGTELVDRRPFVKIAEGVGNPDGLTVDAQGGVWVALYGGSAVHHYDAEGNLADVITLPATKVTSCTFGGEDLSTLYITTSRENLPDDEQPVAGSVFHAEVGVAGLPVRCCAL
ncbi:SMP-30/gluconolactonase/LRE family protein [Actinopolymorpha pittospori]